MRAAGLKIALDFSTFDDLHLGYGLYRYPVDLVRGLAAVRPTAEFVLIGSRPKPVDELADILSDLASGWAYRQFPRRRGRGAAFLDQIPFCCFLRSLGVDLVHSLDLFIPFLPGTPVVVTIYDLMFEIFAGAGAKQSAYVRCLRRLIRHRVSRVIAISETTASDLRRRWQVPPGRLTTVPLGIELPAAEVSTPADPPVVLARYNLLPNKNFSCLIRAFAQVRRAVPHARLVLFGNAGVGAAEQELLKREVRSLGLESAIDWRGYVTDEELDRLYRNATVYVLPSLYEGFGLPLIEAMARGCCVVAHAAGATAEVVGDAGRLVDARTPDGLAAGLLDVLSHPDRYRRWVAAGLERAKLFGRELMARRTFEVYIAALTRTS